jgi:CRISPR-associated endonuclease/helicase Cas3
MNWGFVQLQDTECMNNLGLLWAKTSDSVKGGYHPLLLHLLDVATCADAILERETQITRNQMATILGLEWDKARPWLLLLIACHDLGKACPGFQLKWAESKSLLNRGEFHIPKGYETIVNHAFVSQFALEKLLKEMEWPDDLAELCADAVGGHHGTRATPTKIDRIAGDRYGVDGGEWETVWKNLFKVIYEALNVSEPPIKNNLSGPEFMLLAGLTSFADWIGSNEEWFHFGKVSDCDDLSAWFEHRRQNAEMALDAIGWGAHIPLSNVQRTFTDVFPKCSPPRPLQEAVVQSVTETPLPCVVLIEAPMGEGKTEAAFYAHLELQRRFGHRGLYIAMPTKATGNAMFSRTLDFLKSFAGNRTLDLQLLHGANQLNDMFQKVRFGQIHSDCRPRENNGARIVFCSAN